MGFSLVGGTFYLKDADYRLSATSDETHLNVEPRDLEYSFCAYKLLLGGAVSTPVVALWVLFIIFCDELHGQLFWDCIA